MYRIFYGRRIQEDLDKIPNVDAEKIHRAVKALSLDVLPFGVKKLSGKDNLYRIREGDYRVVYAINHKDKELKIILINHRKESYRNL